MLVLSGLTFTLGLLVFVLAPFWLGPGGLLASSSLINDVDELGRQKLALLKQYLRDEKAAEEGLISGTEWKKRQQFLTNRYLDLTRRADFLSGKGGSSGQSRLIVDSDPGRSSSLCSSSLG